MPFNSRWPQPGFVGKKYFNNANRVVVLGQNPRASNTSKASDSDLEMFRLIGLHSRTRTMKSLNTLWVMMREFMLGVAPYSPAWPPITRVRDHLGLRLDEISYLNLIPLATYGDRIIPNFKEVYDQSTKKQLEILNPTKIVVFGKGAYQKFQEISENRWLVRYIEQRNNKDAPDVKLWLSS